MSQATANHQTQGLAQLEYYKPAWAKAAIVAIRKTDTSIPQLDDGTHEIEEIVVLAWSKHPRNNMLELRKAAATSGFAPTEFLATAPSTYEHKYEYVSWGGFFLGERYHKTGWEIRKEQTDHVWTGWGHFFAADQAFSPLARGEKPQKPPIAYKTVVPRLTALGILKRHREETLQKLKLSKYSMEQRFLQDSINVFELCTRLVSRHIKD